MDARTQLLCRLIVTALAAAGLWVAWSQNPPAQLALQKVTPNLWVIIGDGGNVAFMPTGEGVVMVDDKFAEDAPRILARVRSVTSQPVRYVFNTHQHIDHTGGNQALLAAKAEIIIQKNARANMVADKRSGIPRIAFSDESQVFLGGREVLARYLGRGHTNGDAVIYFPSERVLHTGDLLVEGAPFCDTSAGCSIVEWDKTLEKALQFDFDTVIPGHGPVMKRADLVSYVRTIAAIREQVRKACAGGAEDAAARVDLKGLGLTADEYFNSGVPGMCRELAR